MAKFEILKCSICKRKTDREIDPRRPSLNKCTITYKCAGQLSKISESSMLTENITPPVPGVIDWKSRDSVDSKAAVNTVEQFNLLSGESTLALLSSSLENSLQLKLEVVPPPAEFTEYSFYMPADTSVISGQDQTSSRKTLRFSPDSNLLVYVNGVQLDPNVYDRTISGIIKFDPPLAEESNTIKVVVYEDQPIIYKVLNFDKIDPSISCSTDSSWSNVTLVNSYGSSGSSQILNSYVCNDLSIIGNNEHLIISSEQSSSIQDSLIAIADSPYSSFDRITTLAGNVNDMINNSAQLVYSKTSDSSKLLTNKSELQEIFPPMFVIDKCIDDEISTKTDADHTKFDPSSIV